MAIRCINAEGSSSGAGEGLAGGPVLPSTELGAVVERCREAARAGRTIPTARLDGSALQGGTAPLQELATLAAAERTSLVDEHPLEQLVVETRRLSGRDCEELAAAILRHEPAFHGLTDRGVDLRALVEWSTLDADGLERLVHALVGGGFGDVELRFEPPDPAAVDVDLLRHELARFAGSPAERRPGVRLTGLPFCFVPPEHFRLVYGALEGQVSEHAPLHRQRSYLEDLRARDPDYQAPCRGCRRRVACYALTPIESLAGYRPHLVPSQETSVAFVGASLTPGDRDRLQADDLVFTGPAVQGDALLAILEGFGTILLLDGHFFQRYALTTFELLVALLEGVHVLGAASLGAIRARELANYGMRGSGYVFDVLRRHPIVPYHVVAQTYDEDDRPSSIPLIAVHRLLELAVDAQVIDEHQRDLCYAAAERIHFTQLSVRGLLLVWERDAAIGPRTGSRLHAFVDEIGVDAFDVKRHDALALLGSFREQVLRDGPGHPQRTALHARDTYLGRLRAKYRDDPDRTLPAEWDADPPPSASSSTARHRPAAEAIELARAFFADLDVVVADTSMLDDTGYRMVNVVFVPFFFLGYGNSAGSGYGDTLEEALVGAYGEVIERIPAGSLHRSSIGEEDLEAPRFGFEALPFYESMDTEVRRRFVSDDGTLVDRRYVVATDLFTGSAWSLPRHGARLPNSCGMAAGNDLQEAVLYGLYEVIEHDVYACYETVALFPELRHLNLAAEGVRSARIRSLIGSLEQQGHQVHLVDLPNRYGVPTVLTVLYESDRQLLFSGQCARLDQQAAIEHSFYEALNGHYVSYFGSRDDRRGFEQAGGTPESLLEIIVGPGSALDAPAAPRSVEAQLDELLHRLRRAGIERAFAVDLSPREEFGLAAAKVIVPGTSLRSSRRRPAHHEATCLETHRLAVRAGRGRDAAPNDHELDLLVERMAPSDRYRRPRRRLFKA